jgi:tRNA dimethylallyltransferase
MATKRQPAPLTAPLVVICGPTASGKSNAAMAVAREFNGEIICADSRTIYKGMDIGTAKPSKADQAEIPHHLLDIVTPDQTFTAAEFKKRALAAIEDISSRGRLPIMVGGTGLYIDGVIYDFAFLPPVETAEREVLQTLSVEQLQAKIAEMGLNLPENAQNPRHLVRTIETNGAVPVRKTLRSDTLVLGMDADRKVVLGRVRKRTAEMQEMGLEQEVESLAKTYGWDAPGMSAVGYREWQGYFNGALNLQETYKKIETATMQYAKRQRTWLRRSSDIIWIKNSVEALQQVQTFLQQKSS